MMNDFERGAIWAMELLKKQLTERQDKLRELEAQAGDMYVIIGGTRNLTASIQSQFEVALMKNLREASNGSK